VSNEQRFVATPGTWMSKSMCTPRRERDHPGRSWSDSPIDSLEGASVYGVAAKAREYALR
jgi:hypothetical protein